MSFLKGLFGPPNVEELETKGDVRGLIKALDYEKDAGVRQGAAQSLGAIGDEQAVEPLIATLQDEVEDVRRAAAEALGQIGAPAVEPLIAALQGEVENVRKGAAKTLRQIGAPAVGPLITTLGDAGRNVRKVAAETLGQIGAPAVEPLIAALEDRDADVRKTAAGVLGQIGDARAVGPLIAALQDKTGDVRKTAAGALEQMGDARAMEPLVTALKDKSKLVCRAVVKALDALGWQPDKSEAGAVYWVHKRQWDRCVEIGAPATEPLIAVLGDKDVTVRQAAVETLGQIGDARAREPLIATLATAMDDVQLMPLLSAASAALRKIGSELAVNMIAIQPLSLALRDEDKHRRWAAAILLGAVGGDRAVELLITALKDKDEDVCKAAAEGLGRIGDERAEKPLIAALENVTKGDVFNIRDRSGDIFQAIARALGKIGYEDAASVLRFYVPGAFNFRQEAEEDRPAYWAVVYRAAAEALGEIMSAARHRAPSDPGQVVFDLTYALEYKDEGVRQAAAEALGKIGNNGAVWSLTSALKDKAQTVREAAAEALGKIGDERAVEPLTDALKDEARAVREAAAEALKKIGSQ